MNDLTDPVISVAGLVIGGVSASFLIFVIVEGVERFSGIDGRFLPIIADALGLVLAGLTLLTTPATSGAEVEARLVAGFMAGVFASGGRSQVLAVKGTTTTTEEAQ